MYKVILGQNVKKFDSLFFMNEILGCYSEEELSLRKWLAD